MLPKSKWYFSKPCETFLRGKNLFDSWKLSSPSLIWTFSRLNRLLKYHSSRFRDLNQFWIEIIYFRNNILLLILANFFWNNRRDPMVNLHQIKTEHIDQKWSDEFFLLFMVNSFETKKKIPMRPHGGIVAGLKSPKSKIKSPKHAKIMILSSVQVATFLFDEMS